VAKRILRCIHAIIMMSVIFIASGTPGEDLPEFGIIDFFVKKGGHMVGYALLAVSFFMALYAGNGQKTTRTTVLALVLSVLYAVSDEYHQSFVPGRSAAASDVCIDTVGMMAGLAVLHFFMNRKKQAAHVPVKGARS